MEEKNLESPADAVMAIAVLAVHSDGQLQDAELDRLTALAHINPLFQDIGDKREYVARIGRIIEGQPREKVLNGAYRLLPAHLRESAYAWAAEIVELDDKVTEEEKGFLEKLRHALDISDACRKQVASMMRMLKGR